MRVCIVGNGPSAEGKGELIDACDFVVRMKAYWAHAALNAGKRVDALAWYGSWNGWRDLTEKGLPNKCEHWLTHCPQQIEIAKDTGYRRFDYFSMQATFHVIRILPSNDWHWMAQYLGGMHPSTGLVSIHMALKILNPSELLLFGYDSLDVSDPNYYNPRWSEKDIIEQCGFDPKHPPHDTRREKEVIYELATIKRWCGCHVNVTVDWHACPLKKD